MSNSIEPAQQGRLFKLFDDGLGVRAAARAEQVHRNTALRYRHMWRRGQSEEAVGVHTQIALTVRSNDLLKKEAIKRGISKIDLCSTLFETIIDDNLFSALLDE